MPFPFFSGDDFFGKDEGLSSLKLGIDGIFDIGNLFDLIAQFEFRNESATFLGQRRLRYQSILYKMGLRYQF